MMKSIRNISLALMLTTTGMSQSHAQGIPVIDTASIAQTLISLNNQAQSLINDATQISNQVQQLTNLQSQLQNMQQRLTAITGIKDISSILNNSASQVQRQAAGSLQDILNSALSGTGITGGNAGRLNSSISRLKTDFSLPDLSALRSSDVPRMRAVANVASVGLTAAATGEDGYTRSNEGMQRVNELIGRIDTTPDLKSSIDLNTRMNAEVAQQMNEVLRLLAVTASAQGAMALDKVQNDTAAIDALRASN